MAQTLIIYAHPYEGSFNHAILEEVKAGLERAKRQYTVIDLYADGFDPRYTTEELALFSKGETLDPLVERYKELIDSSDSWIFISPVWWSNVPSILKGFVDKVMKQNWAYVSTNRGLKGKLDHVKSAWIITTSIAPTFYLRFFAGNGVKGVFLNTSVRQLGVRRRTWTNMGNIGNSSQDQRKKFLAEVRERAARV
ncbi:MAG: NAD(P)H-dependent oxidoreductase [Actinomycetaceae bacterium]|nr:NAD(P)H-dependent oxidoreductase [Actinomycetaceae bacterium]